MDQKDNFISDLLAKYKLALTRLDDALTKLEQQPTTLEEFAATNDALRTQLDELIQWKVRGKLFKKDNDVLRNELNTLNKDYWGRPKKIEAKSSKKNIQQDDYIKNLTKTRTGNKLKQMESTAELTNFTICTPPDFVKSDSTKIGVFGFGPGDFYKFLNAVPLKEKTVIYTVPKIEAHGEFFDWTKKVISECDCVFISDANKRLVISRTDDYKNVYVIDNKFDTIEKIVRMHGKKN